MPRSKWGKYVWVADNWLQMELERQEVKGEMSSILSDLEENSKGQAKYAQINLSFTRTDDSDISNLLQWLSKHKIKLKIIRLRKTNITGKGLEELCTFICQQKSCLTEIHLNSNHVTTDQTYNFLYKLYQTESYPETRSGWSVPLWIRIDSNYIDVDKLLEQLKKQEIEICTCEQRGCTVDNCKAVKGRNVPVFHLPRLQDQKTARRTDGSAGNSYLQVPSNANEFSDNKNNWDSSASDRDSEMIKSPSGKGGKDNDGDEQTATPTSDQARSDARSPSGENQDGNSKEKKKKKQKESNHDWWAEDWWAEDWWDEGDDWWEDNSWNQSPQRKKKDDKNSKSRDKESSNWWDSNSWWKESYREDDWEEDRSKKTDDDKKNEKGNKGRKKIDDDKKDNEKGKKGRHDDRYNGKGHNDNYKGEKRDGKGKDNEKGKGKGKDEKGRYDDKGKNGKDDKGKGKGKDEKGRYDDKGKGKGKDDKGKGKGKEKGKNGWESLINMMESDKKGKNQNGWNSWNGWNNNWYDVSKEVERVTSYYMQGLASRMPSPLPIPPGLDVEVSDKNLDRERPFYVFIDAEAILKMAFPSDRCLFSFEQLAFLCSNQIMSHLPRFDSGLPIMQSVQDNERILFIFTDLAMQMLFELAKSTDEDSLANKMLSLQFTETSYLPLGFARGFIEMVESKHHDNVVVLTDDEQAYGKRLNLSDDHICHIDFVFYWDRLLQGDVADRTILISGNKKVVQFFDQCLGKRSVRCFNIDELQSNIPQELSPFSSVSCWEQVEDLLANKKCLTADVLSKSLESLRVQKA